MTRSSTKLRRIAHATTHYADSDVLRFMSDLSHCRAVVHASSRSRRIWTHWALCVVLFDIAAAAHASAQRNPNAPPASIPTVLMTRDPSRASASMNVITKPPKPAARVTVAAATSGKTAKAKTGANAATAAGPFANIKVQGLTGTLNKGDVHQTMEARQELFDACIRESRRRLRWVSGAIHFAFKVDGEGRILEVHTTTSNIGHRELESCLFEAVASTQFPKPAGRANAEFGWGLTVEPVSGQTPETANAKLMTSVARKQAREVFSTCEIRRRRARFRITAYITPGGRMLSAGAVSLPAHAQDKVDCVLDQVAKWHMPKVKRSSKVSFELR